MAYLFPTVPFYHTLSSVLLVKESSHSITFSSTFPFTLAKTQSWLYSKLYVPKPNSSPLVTSHFLWLSEWGAGVSKFPASHHHIQTIVCSLSLKKFWFEFQSILVYHTFSILYSTHTCLLLVPLRACFCWLSSIIFRRLNLSGVPILVLRDLWPLDIKQLYFYVPIAPVRYNHTPCLKWPQTMLWFFLLSVFSLIELWLYSYCNGSLPHSFLWHTTLASPTSLTIRTFWSTI